MQNYSRENSNGLKFKEMNVTVNAVYDQYKWPKTYGLFAETFKDNNQFSFHNSHCFKAALWKIIAVNITINIKRIKRKLHILSGKI